MITLRDVILRRGPHILLQNVNWTIFHKQRIGVIGANGAGKTSLFSVILGELGVDAGEIEIPPKLRFAHVAQETPGIEKSAIDFVLDGDSELRTLEAKLLEAEQDNDGTLIAKLHARMGEIDAYTANARAAQLLSGLGFSHAEQQKQIKEFSGGWRVRLNLAKALMCRSDILLLDEPTNHLDLDAVIWLENWLIKYPGTLLLISHDREFLDHVVDHIVHLEHQELKLYSGNYSSFEKQRAAQILVQQAAYEKQQKHIAHLQSFVDRFKAKASKARQAQSRMKAIEKMELIDAVQIDSAFHFSFKEPDKCPTPLVKLEDAIVAYGDHIVLTDLNFSIGPKERMALLGPNGAGKSSLIKLIAGEIAPATGMRETNNGTKIGYFAQHQVDHLQLDESPLQHLKDIAENTKEQVLRTFLGSFGFVGNRVMESVNNFSGGEKSRLALALIVWQKPNLLLLDEPTNHLDMDMRHALSLALQDYQGAMILVSHDRFLVKTTVDQLLLVANGKLTPFDGDLDDYEKWLTKFRKEENITAEKPTVSKKSQRQEDAKQRELRKPYIEKIKSHEDAIKKLEQELNAIEKNLADTEIYDEKNKKSLQELLLKQSEIKKKIQSEEELWLKAISDLEKL